MDDVGVHHADGQVVGIVALSLSIVNDGLGIGFHLI
jgi:hypothetical protein